MNIERKPENYDWVTARAACSAATIFEKLKMQVEENVATRVAMLPHAHYFTFKFVTNGSTSFSAVVMGNQIHDTVRFHLTDEKITVSHNEISHELTATLCNDGECRVKTRGQEYDVWQILKMLLEDLFFAKY